MLKSHYKKLCKESNTISIFCQPWWLDAVCGISDWDVVIAYDKNNNIIGAMPYCYTNKKKKMIGMPLLTQCLGPSIKYPKNIDVNKRLSIEKKAIFQFVEQLPPFSKFVQNLNYRNTNWLPFYWKGFKQTTRYTYVIRDISDPEQVYKSFGRKAKDNIRKASKRVKCETTDDLELFYRINSMSFERQGYKTPYTFNFLNRIDQACKQNNARKILYAKDSKDRIHSAVYLIIDRNFIYLLMSGGDPKLRSSGAKSLLVWESIQRFNHLSKGFNFEGSMIENVEAYNRSFNAEQIPYHQIYVYNSRVQKIRKLLREIR